MLEFLRILFIIVLVIFAAADSYALYVNIKGNHTGSIIVGTILMAVYAVVLGLVTR